MNILLITGIFPPDIGGPATYVPRIATSLAVRGHRITVLTLGELKIQDDSEYQYKVVRIARGTRKPLRWLRTIYAILRLGSAVDLLYVNGLAMEASLANLVLRKPMVQKIVGDLIWERARQKGWIKDDFQTFQHKAYSWKVSMLKAMRRWWIRSSDQVIVPSRYLGGWVESLGVPEQHIRVIYNAIERVGGHSQVVVQINTKYKIVTVGRLVAWKGIDEVIEALRSLADVGLVVVGDGPERAALEQRVEQLDLFQRVFFAGARSHHETMALMKACDAFVLNSRYEGLPHIVLEAMALGLPVVATCVGGTPEVVQDGVNGLLVPAGNTVELHASLKRILKDDSLRTEIIAQGHETVSTKFSLRTMVNQTENALYELFIRVGG